MRWKSLVLGTYIECYSGHAVTGGFHDALSIFNWECLWIIFIRIGQYLYKVIRWRKRATDQQKH